MTSISKEKEFTDNNITIPFYMVDVNDKDTNNEN
jgi:hypothetical protein